MKNAKRKGNAGERELLAILAPFGAERHEQRYIGGLGNPDIGFALEGSRYHAECKRVERLNIHVAYQQAKRDAMGAAVPIVVHRRNGEPWLCTLALSDFLPKETAQEAPRGSDGGENV